MTRFNFLRAPSLEALERLQAIELNPAMRRAMASVMASLAIVAATVTLEHARLVRADADVRLAQSRVATAERNMHDMLQAVADVTRLSATARIVRETRDSGRASAARVAEIGARLPHRSWLTSLHDDDGVVILDGRAEDYRTLGRVIRELDRAKTVANAVLLSSHTVSAQGSSSWVEYQLRLAERGR